jgi:hypothetical protein
MESSNSRSNTGTSRAPKPKKYIIIVLFIFFSNKNFSLWNAIYCLLNCAEGMKILDSKIPTSNPT